MSDYFSHIVKRLSFDDMNVLSILFDKDAVAKFKAVKKSEVFNSSELTEANFRKVVYRLDAINFLETVVGNKEHRYFITNFGVKAINDSLNEEVAN